MKKGYKDIAEKYERYAKAAERRSSSYKIGAETSGEVSKLYEKAANAWKDEGRYTKAIENYNKAIKNAYDKKIESRIRNKLEELPKQGRKNLGRGLERRFGLAISAIMSFVAALFFMSFNLAGYTIGELPQNNSTLISIGLFISGLVFAFFYLKNKNITD